MKPAIDSYSFHRYFGYINEALETDPGRRLTFQDFLDVAADEGVGGVSLESCFFDDLRPATVDGLRAALDTSGLDRVWAWGHPSGLGSGSDLAALDDMIAHLSIARDIGTGVMRVCAGGRRTRPETWQNHRAAILPLFERALPAAEAAGVVMAIENHLDLTAAELCELVETIDSPWLGVCLDTGNTLRMFEDPVAAARKLAPHTRATHLKDVTAIGGDPKTFAFWPSVATGRGLVDIAAILRILANVGYDGLLAVEIDYLHPDHGDEHHAVADSVTRLNAMLSEL